MWLLNVARQSGERPVEGIGEGRGKDKHSSAQEELDSSPF